jgi:hypothetical protein
MRFLSYLTALILTASIAAADTATDQLREDHNVGDAVGLCFVAGCQVFRGVVATDAPKSGEAVTIRVAEASLECPLFQRPSTSLTTAASETETLGHFWH